MCDTAGGECVQDLQVAVLGRAWRRTGARLLLWSTICFVGFAINNLLLFVDLVLLPHEIDLSLWRALANFGGMAALVVALVWESEQ